MLKTDENNSLQDVYVHKIKKNLNTNYVYTYI